jgi:hypothetical protein
VSEQSDILSTIHRRYELLTRGSPEISTSIFDGPQYSRFDDWEPLTLQGPEYIEKEAEVAKLLSGFRYEIYNPVVQVRGNFALALYYIHYMGQIRTRPFDIWARATTVLVRDGGWKIWHEHLSRLPGRPAIKLEQAPKTLPSTPHVEGAGARPALDPVSRAILEILGDGKERDPVDLTILLPERVGRYVDSSEVKKRCEELERLGMIERVGPEGLLAKYRLKRPASTQP